MTTGGDMDLFFDDNAPLTEQEREELKVPDPKEKRPCPVCKKMLVWVADGSRPRAHKCKALPVQESPPTQGRTPLVPNAEQLNIFDMDPPAPPSVCTDSGPTVDEVVAKYVETRDLIAEKTKALEAELAPLKDFQKKREAWLLGKLDASGVESMRTAHGTCFVDWKDSVSVADAETFMNWVHEAWEDRRTFLTNAANKTAVKQRLSENEPPPPGVNYVKIKDVKVRRA